MAAYDMLNHQQHCDMISSEAMLQYIAAVRELEELPPGVPGVSNLIQASQRYREAACTVSVFWESYFKWNTVSREEFDSWDNEYDMALKDLESICEKLVRRDIQ